MNTLKDLIGLCYVRDKSQCHWIFRIKYIIFYILFWNPMEYSYNTFISNFSLIKKIVFHFSIATTHMSIKIGREVMLM